MNALMLSIVIPAYNEEFHIKACLDAIALQTVAPKEVFVVDNNSTDTTVKIASKYSFVKILREKQQGQVFAQRIGFNAAKSDILGRIDADTLLPPDWVEKVIKEFESDSYLVAVTGDAEPYDIPLKEIAEIVFRVYHVYGSRWIAGHPMLWGANCAIRRSAWLKIDNLMAYRYNFWEDYEMSFLLAPLGRIKFLPSLIVSCSFRSAHKSLLAQIEYHFRAVRTFWLYAHPLRTIIFFLVRSTMVLIFPFAMLDRTIRWFQGSNR
ncbi:glycosyltransferase family 2 protein [Candidatus Saccharibacteria bacterium]|nr:glycosyltransferase family 2 protein [Candidatus Saccharibacteria bacterium]